MALQLADESIEIRASSERIMGIYRDVEKWPEWDHELEKVELFGPFARGSEGRLRPKGGPLVRFKLLSVDEHGFTDASRLPFAWLHFEHVITKTKLGVVVRHSAKISGPLSIFFFFIFKQKIGKGLPKALKELKAKAEQYHE